MQQKYVKCPLCGLNYMPEGEEACLVCKPVEPVQQTKRRGRTAGAPKPKLEGNVAFKCNYCDGGTDDVRLGFSKVCSPDNIRHNIEIKPRAWCKDSACKCAAYFDGQLPYAELEKEFPCCESRILIDWKVQIGANKAEGARKGRHRKISRDVTSGLGILTALLPGRQEGERAVFGVFIVDKSVECDANGAEGFVQCTTEYKLQLSPDEAQKILFWNYFFCAEAPNAMRWKRQYRYLDDMQCAQILRDIAAVKAGTADEARAKEMLYQYCESKGIFYSVIPKNCGALTRRTDV